MEKLGVKLAIGKSSVLVKIAFFACDASLQGILYSILYV
jgi:hypothetical protein